MAFHLDYCTNMKKSSSPCTSPHGMQRLPWIFGVDTYRPFLSYHSLHSYENVFTLQYAARVFISSKASLNSFSPIYTHSLMFICNFPIVSEFIKKKNIIRKPLSNCYCITILAVLTDLMILIFCKINIINKPIAILLNHKGCVENVTKPRIT